MLVSVFVLVGCQSAPSGSESEWRVRAFHAAKLNVVSANTVDQKLVDQMIEDYKKSPKNNDYSELTLSHVLEGREGGGMRYFIFNLRYVDDVNVVYVIDSRNVVLDKFLASPWIR
jgi:hypothetical protein